jgi:hypothetical protein
MVAFAPQRGKGHHPVPFNDEFPNNQNLRNKVLGAMRTLEGSGVVRFEKR